MNFLSSLFSKNLNWIFSAIILISLLLGIYSEKIYLLGIPVFFLLTVLVFIDFSKIYFSLLFFLPLSVQYFFPNGFSTDLPTEPLMILLMFVYFFYILLHPEKIDKKFFNHPVIILLFVHLTWTIVAVIYSTGIVFSLKYLLAKIWYVVPFVFVSALILRDKKEIGIAFWCVFTPMLLIAVQTMIRHGLTGFEFDTINKSVQPFFLNHVNYAAMLSIIFPFVWFARNFYKKNSSARIFLNFGVLLFILAIYLSFTRTSWIAVLCLPFAYWMVRKKLFRWVIVGSFGAILIALIYIAFDNKYLKFAPRYEKTIVHHNLEDQLSATYQMTDVSGMERVYRWIAAIRMSFDKPIVGYGPNNFYYFYKKYTVSSFATYVSDNPEHSTTHNYFLMILVEQGYVGLLIFLAMTIYIFMKAEKIYHQTKEPFRKHIVMACLLSFIAIMVNLMLSDLIEVDKIGSIFFVIISIFVNQDIINREEKNIYNKG